MEKEAAEKTKSHSDRWNRMSTDQLGQELQHASQSCDRLAGQLKCDSHKWSRMVASMQAQIASMQLLYDSEVSCLKRRVEDLHEQLAGSQHTVHQGPKSATVQCAADGHSSDSPNTDNAAVVVRDSPGQHTQLQPTASDTDTLGVELQCSSPQFCNEAEFEGDLDSVLDAVANSPVTTGQCDPSLKDDTETDLKASHDGDTTTRSQVLITPDRSTVGKRKGLRSDNAGKINLEPQTCQKCKTNFSSLSKLKKHVCREPSRSDKKPHKCPDCEAAFPCLSLLKRHAIFHSGDRPFKCAECGLCFPRPSSLKRHMATHLSKKPYQCADCAASFAECSNARRHRTRKKHRVEKRQVDFNFKPYQCSECETRFARAHSLKVHLLTHMAEERPFKCLQCGKSYKTSRNLISHRHYMHSGRKAQLEKRQVDVKLHQCTQCEASFARAIGLKMHAMTHASQERPDERPGTPLLFEGKEHHGEDTDPVQRQVRPTTDRVDDSGGEVERSSPEFSDQPEFESNLELDSGRDSLADASLPKCKGTVPLQGNTEMNLNISCSDGPTPVLSTAECPSVNPDVRAAMDAVSSINDIDAVSSINDMDDVSSINDSMHKGNTPSMGQHPPSLVRAQMYTGQQRLTLARGCTADASQTKTKAQTCAKCNTAFSSVNKFKEHTCEDSVKKLHKCTECDTSFPWFSFLKRHKVCHSGDRPYRCAECGSCFALQSALKRHMATHLSKKPYQCADCAASFADSSSARRHRTGKRHRVEKIQVDLNLHQCSECEAKFAQTGSLKTHMLTHLCEARPFRCVQCGNSYRTASNLRSHRRYMHAGHGTRKCSQCDATFTSSYRLLKHMAAHTGLKAPRCDACGKTFSTAVTLKSHVDIMHKGRKRLQCSQCDERFSWSTQLERHMVTHTGVKPYLCAECGASFTLKSHLKVHISRHACRKSKSFNPLMCVVNSSSDGTHKGVKGRASVKKHLCAECGGRFARKSHLSSHMLTHTGSERHVCPHCGEGFTTLRRLKSHAVQVHEDERPFKCTECYATFTSANVLSYHRFTHTNKKPFECTKCDASFIKPSLLRAHMGKHGGEKPFKCTHCLATFTAAGHLKYHQFTHTGNKPHKCSVCDASYVTPSQLRFHMASHTGDKPHKCEECGAGFFYPNRLKLHMVVHTGEKKYKCEECGACFSQSGGRKAHMRRIHSNGQPLACTNGSASLKTAGNLKKTTRLSTSLISARLAIDIPQPAAHPKFGQKEKQ